MELDPKVEQIFDADESNFEEIVLQGSQDRVVVIDFWAPWCEPCKTLGPIIEEVVRDLGAGIALAKVNVDENQQLAMMFRVQSIPAVKILHQGKLVNEFTGALPKEQIDALLRPLLPEAPPTDIPPSEQAKQMLALGDLEGAKTIFTEVLKEKPDDGPSLIGLARIALQQANIDLVHEYVNLIEQGTNEYAQAQALLAQIEFAQKCKAAGGRSACSAHVLSDSNNLEALFQLACCQAAEGEFEEALKAWFNIVERKPNFSEGAAQQAMVSVFNLLGRENNELVKEYQRRLYQLLN